MRALRGRVTERRSAPVFGVGAAGFIARCVLMGACMAVGNVPAAMAARAVIGATIAHPPKPDDLSSMADLMSVLT